MGTATDLTTFAEQVVADGTLRLCPETEFAGFIRKLRRTIPYYLFRVEKRARGRPGREVHVLVELQGLDRLLHPLCLPAAGLGAALRPLARARVHPNAVTISQHHSRTGAIPMLGDRARRGRFWTGFAVAYGMSVLVIPSTGSWRALTFTDSRIGNRAGSRSLDMVHPPFWLSRLGLRASARGRCTGGSTPGSAAVLVVVFYVVDRLILKIYPRFFQRAFHTHSRLDGRVRTFIARSQHHAADVQRSATRWNTTWKPSTWSPPGRS